MSAVGYKLRPTTIIPIIAVSICAVMEVMQQRGKREKIFSGLRNVFIAAASCMLVFTALNLVMQKHVPRGYEDRAMPETHWLMMGLNESTNGSFAGSDVAYSESFQTKAEKREANIAEIRRRLSDMGPVRYGILVLKKMARVWTGGTGVTFERAKYASSFPVFYEYVMGGKNAGFRIYVQAFQTVVFFFAFICICFEILRKKRTGLYLYILTLLGSIAFFILWEANDKYFICFTYVCLLLMADGIQKTETAAALAGKKWRSVRVFADKKYNRLKAAACMGGLMIWCLAVCACIVPQYHMRSIYQSVMRDKFSVSRQELKNASVICQTLQEKSSDDDKSRWNNLMIAFTKSKKPKAKDHYQVRLYSMPSRSVLYEEAVTGSDLGDDGKFVISGSYEKERGDTHYMLELEHVGRKYSMYPYLQTGCELDQYPYGSLAVDGRPSRYDLCIGLYWDEML